jgi:hypothetical protein
MDPIYWFAGLGQGVVQAGAGGERCTSTAHERQGGGRGAYNHIGGGAQMTAGDLGRSTARSDDA